jgi:hypothetical protein
MCSIRAPVTSDSGRTDVAWARRVGLRCLYETGGQVVEIWRWSAAEIVGRVRSRDVSIIQVAQAFVDRIERTNPTINATVAFIPERALAAAAAADRRLSGGGSVRALEGVPFTVKDVIPTAGGEDHLWPNAGTPQRGLRVFVSVQRAVPAAARPPGGHRTWFKPRRFFASDYYFGPDHDEIRPKYAGIMRVS